MSVAEKATTLTLLHGRPFPVVIEVEIDRLGDPPDGQITGQDPVAVIDPAQARADQGQGRVVEGLLDMRPKVSGNRIYQAGPANSDCEMPQPKEVPFLFTICH